MIDPNPARNAIYDAVDNGMIDEKMLIQVLITWMSEADVAEMIDRSPDLQGYFPELQDTDDD